MNRVCALFLLTLAAPATAAEPLAVGHPLAPLVLQDQHGEEVRVGNDTALLLFARDMAGGDVAEEALGEDGAAVLDRAAAVFVSDISGMPGIITRFFALPAMRKRPYRMLLDRDGAATAALPHRDAHVTVVRLDQLTVRSIEYVGTGAELRTLLVGASDAGSAGE